MIQERIKEIETVKEKIVPVKETVIQRVPIQQVIEKLVQSVIEVPKVI